MAHIIFCLFFSQVKVTNFILHQTNTQPLLYIFVKTPQTPTWTNLQRLSRHVDRHSLISLYMWQKKFPRICSWQLCILQLLPLTTCVAICWTSKTNVQNMYYLISVIVLYVDFIFTNILNLKKRKKDIFAKDLHLSFCELESFDI